jgi:hypothetical protein
MIRLLAKPMALAVLVINAVAAIAADKARPASDELDVTMQIIVDPDAKLPDEVIRRIPLPARKTEKQPSTSEPAKPTSPEPATKGQERAREAQDLGSEMSQRAKDKAREANDQREEARRAIADERRRNHDPPSHPSPPGRPPR